MWNNKLTTLTYINTHSIFVKLGDWNLQLNQIERVKTILELTNEEKLLTLLCYYFLQHRASNSAHVLS